MSVIIGLTPNDLAVWRMVNRAFRTQLAAHNTFHLSLPSPPELFSQHWSKAQVMRLLSLKQRRQLLCLTAASGVLANLQAAVRLAGCLPTDEVCKAAVAAGSEEMCLWLWGQGCRMGLICAAARAGRGELVQELLWLWGPTEGDMVPRLVCTTARGGHLDLVEQLRPLAPVGEPRPRDFLPAVAEGCELPVLQREYGAAAAALDGMDESDWFGMVVDMVEGTTCSTTPDWEQKLTWTLDLLDGLLEVLPNGLPAKHARNLSFACAPAVSRQGALPRLQWLLPRLPGLLQLRHRNYLKDANDMDTHEYLLDRAMEHGGWGILSAASHHALTGKLDFLRAIHRRRPLGDSPGWFKRQIIRDALHGGHRAVVDWLLGEDVLGPGWIAQCPVASAAASGDIELMALTLASGGPWMLTHGCRWGDHPWRQAAESGVIEAALEWLADHNCPAPQGEAMQAYTKAAANGDLRTLARLLQLLGRPYPAGLAVECVRPLPLGSCAAAAVVRLLLQAGCPVDWPAVLEAAVTRWHFHGANVLELEELRAEVKARGAGGVQGGPNETWGGLADHNCPAPQGDGRMQVYKKAAANGDLRTLARLLQMLGQPYPAGLAVECVRSLPLESCAAAAVVRLLLQAGCSVDWPAVLEAAVTRWHFHGANVMELEDLRAEVKARGAGGVQGGPSETLGFGMA
ncbi:hypothetical protein PLESTM_001438100 [Pleodorina starrii]|nr:hypothetical protein PLESTM_001438100 [Pleodorina starrii]